eukprot:c19201_g1_i1.p1 GENE.c19201_g1_i1~~c19201_g1_i1.p1  ORF type:complete len:362 (+),score=114.51 c19201_g1_i1:22-1086(+)
MQQTLTQITQQTTEKKKSSPGCVLYCCCFIWTLATLIVFFTAVNPMIQAQDYIETNCYINRTFVAQTYSCSKKTGSSCGYQYRCEVHVTYVDNTFHASHGGVAYDTYLGSYSSYSSGKYEYCNRFTVGNTYTCFYDPDNFQTVAMDTTWEEWRMTMLWVLVALNICCPIFCCFKASNDEKGSQNQNQTDPYIPLTEIQSGSIQSQPPVYANQYPPGQYPPASQYPGQYPPANQYPPAQYPPPTQYAPAQYQNTNSNLDGVQDGARMILGKLQTCQGDFSKLDCLKQEINFFTNPPRFTLRDASCIVDAFENEFGKKDAVVLLHKALQNKADLDPLLDRAGITGFRRELLIAELK